MAETKHGAGEGGAMRVTKGWAIVQDGELEWTVPSNEGLPKPMIYKTLDVIRGVAPPAMIQQVEIRAVKPKRKAAK